MDEGKYFELTHFCRLSACCHLRTQRKCNKFHLVGKFREGVNSLAKGLDYARPDSSKEQPSRLVCISFDDAQYGAVLPKAWSA